MEQEMAKAGNLSASEKLLQIDTQAMVLLRLVFKLKLYHDHDQLSVLVQFPKLVFPQDFFSDSFR